MLRLTNDSLQRLLRVTGASSAFVLSSLDGRVVVPVNLEVSSVPAARMVIGRRRVVLDWARATISCGSDRVTLSRLELRLLAALAAASPGTAERAQLIADLWPAKASSRRADGRVGLPVAICALRKRFAAIGVTDAVRTVRGRGYTLSV